MKGFRAIYSRELSGLFLAPLAWILLCSTLLYEAFFFLLFLGRNGGEVFNGQRRSQEQLEQWFAPETAKQLWDFGLEAVDLVTGRIRNHRIDCDLKPGVLTVAAKRSHADYLRETEEKLKRDYGYHRLRLLDREEPAYSS